METTAAILERLIQTIVEQYESELNRLPMKKNTRECLIDGFKSGFRQGVYHTVKMLDVKVNP